MLKNFNLLLRTAMLFLVIFIYLIIGSCKKEIETLVEPNAISNQESINKNMLTEILYLPTQSAKKIAFSSLNAKEKVALFKLQFDYILKEIPLTPQQSSYIKELSANISPNLYSDDKQIWLAYRATIANYETKASNLFSRDFISKYFSELITPMAPSPVILKTKISNDIVIKVEDEKPTCQCSTESDWCLWTTHCELVGQLCKYKLNACGFMYGYQCNGWCKIQED